MAADAAGRRHQKLYAMLLRLYPRPFRERYGEAMAQTFQDRYREHRGSGQGLFGFALWIYCDTMVGSIRENIAHMNQLGKTMLRVALGALAVWMVPVVAAQFVEDWHWGVEAFVRVYVLFFFTGMVFALIARKMGAWSYKAGIGVALAAGFALGWSNMVHVADSHNPANLWYHSVLLVGFVGASLARLSASGLSRTLFVMAATLALIAVVLPSGAPPYLARNMAVGHAVNVALFTASGLLFRHATLTRSK